MRVCDCVCKKENVSRAEYEHGVLSMAGGGRSFLCKGGLGHRGSRALAGKGGVRAREMLSFVRRLHG